MRRYLVFCLVFIFFQALSQKHTISGYIKDQSSGESLIGASIINLKTQQGTTTNNYGFFSITQASDSVHLRVSYIGYENQVFKFFLNRDTRLNIELVAGTELQAVEIVGTSEDQIQETTQMSSIDVPIEQIKKMPALLGEVDVFKVLQLLPGVNGGTEGSSGLYVRGGGPDQNLILLDGVPVYNASHLFGFFSVFNADAINHVELIKGGFPARYGGRLSSVIDINMKEGNLKQVKGEGSVGLIASRLTVEGPIIKDRTSFIISGRRTYADAIARPFMNRNAWGGYYFYDLNLKVNHKFNDKNRLYLSSYLGDDHAQVHERSFRWLKDEFGNVYGSTNSRTNAGLKWGNVTTALRWNNAITNKLFANLTATYSRYRFRTYGDDYNKTVNFDPPETETSYALFDYRSGIRDYALKLDFDYLPFPNHFVKFGAQAIDHSFSAGVLHVLESEKIDTVVGPKPIRAQEYFAYIEDDFKVSNKLKVNFGVHGSAFYVADKFYKSLQPRLAARYLLTKDISVKASYAQMTQFIHLLTNAGLGLPTDLWVPVTPSNGPEKSWVSAVGGAYNINNIYELSLEGYYKEMSGLIEYKDGASYLNIESDWQTKVEAGKGRSYGAEVFLQKKKGRLNGWVGYTLSKTDRTFPNINNGKTFPYKYDRRHDIEIATTYDLRPNKAFSVTWVYATGNALTIPQSTYSRHISDIFGYNSGSNRFYSDRNSYRMRDYHRLDISYTITKKKKWGERSWTFSAYNAYSQRNPFFVNIENDRKGHKHFVQYTLFPIIPSFAYRFKF
jgi:hypothetical protein